MFELAFPLILIFSHVLASEQYLEVGRRTYYYGEMYSWRGRSRKNKTKLIPTMVLWKRITEKHRTQSYSTDGTAAYCFLPENNGPRSLLPPLAEPGQIEYLPVYGSINSTIAALHRANLWSSTRRRFKSLRPQLVRPPARRCRCRLEVSIHSSTSRVRRTFKPIKRQSFYTPSCISYGNWKLVFRLRLPYLFYQSRSLTSS